MMFIVIWGLTALTAMLLAGLLAAMKNRDYSAWMGWAFIVPPIVLLYALWPTNPGPRPRRPSLDELDRRR